MSDKTEEIQGRMDKAFHDWKNAIAKFNEMRDEVERLRGIHEKIQREMNFQLRQSCQNIYRRNHERTLAFTHTRNFYRRLRLDVSARHFERWGRVR